MNNKQNVQNIATVFVFRTQSDNLRFGEKVAFQSQCGIKRIEQAYSELFNIQNLHYQKLPNGKYVCEEGYFSISHSGNYVAVAISTQPIGVDLQRFSGAKIIDVANKFFTEREKQQMQNSTENFYLTWCKKEALWKSLYQQPPTIASVETTDKQFTTDVLVLENEYFYLAVTGSANIIVE